jgi:hypothetical protein
MASTIKLKNSNTKGNAPSSLAQGEVAINVNDGNLFYGDGSSVLQNFALNNITASGDISASGIIYSNHIQPADGTSTLILDTNDLYLKSTSARTDGAITASGNISSSGTIIGANISSSGGVITGYDLSIDRDATIGRRLNASIISGSTIEGQNLISDSHITASGNISASGNVYAEGVSTPKIMYENDSIVQILETGISVTGQIIATGVGGNITAAGNISSSGNLIGASASFGQIYDVNDDGDTLIDFPGSNMVDLYSAGRKQINVQFSSIRLNDSGNDVDVYIEGDSDANLFRTDASSDRVGIGIMTPTAKLDVAGNIKTNSNITASGNISSSGTITANKLVLDQGDQSNPSLIFGSDTDTGIYRSGNDILAFQVGGGNVEMTIAGSTNTINSNAHLKVGSSTLERHITASGNISASGQVYEGTYYQFETTTRVDSDDGTGWQGPNSKGILTMEDWTQDYGTDYDDTTTTNAEGRSLMLTGWRIPSSANYSASIKSMDIYVQPNVNVASPHHYGADEGFSCSLWYSTNSDLIVDTNVVGSSTGTFVQRHGATVTSGQIGGMEAGNMFEYNNLYVSQSIGLDLAPGAVLYPRMKSTEGTNTVYNVYWIVNYVKIPL